MVAGTAPWVSAAGGSVADMSWLALARTALVVATAVFFAYVVVVEERRYRTLIRRRKPMRRRWR